MANIFAPGGEELAKQKDLDELTGEKVINDSLNNYLNRTGIYGTHQLKDPTYPSAGWGVVATFHASDKSIQLFADDEGNLYFRSGIVDDIQSGKRKFSRIYADNEIDALKARISALEKQIGGVLSSVLDHLKHRLVVA